MDSVDGPEPEDCDSAVEAEYYGPPSDDYVPEIRVSAGNSCPWCGETGIPVIFGYPTEEWSEAVGAGQVILAGCICRGDDSDPQWQCPGDPSHAWTSGNPASPLWKEALAQALALNGRHGQEHSEPSF